MSTSGGDPTIDGWRDAVATLGRLLYDIEANPTVELARTGCLTGGSAAAWDEADRGVTRAWETYRAVDSLLYEATADPARTADLLASSSVPGLGGPADPTTAMRAAKAAVDAASAVAERLANAWEHQAERLRDAQGLASDAGDGATARAAEALADLLGHDPFAVADADIAAVEASAATAADRHAAARTAEARLDFDLNQARAEVTDLKTDLRSVQAELDHAASRIAGFTSTEVVTDLGALGDWLDRIAATATRDAARAATDLAGWSAAARQRRTELDEALSRAREGMRRRDEGRGLWKALRAKAAARRLDEQPHVTEVLTAARQELWRAPCDLDAADRALAELARVLEHKAASPSPNDAPSAGAPRGGGGER